MPKSRGRTKRPLDKVNEKTPRKLIEKYEELGCNQLRLSKEIKVNYSYVNHLLKDGLEPTDKTPEGRRVRIALFLPRRKSGKPKRELPDFIKQWNHLPKEERHKVIQQYLEWKSSNEEKK